MKEDEPGNLIRYQIMKCFILTTICFLVSECDASFYLLKRIMLGAVEKLLFTYNAFHIKLFS